PLDYPLPGDFSGAIVSTGTAASFTFAKRALTLWPVSPGPGDSFAWYNPDGTARLWTPQSGDLMTVNKDALVTVGRPSLSGGAVVVEGQGAYFGLARRTLTTTWSANTNAGDLFAWYNPDGTARLWTWQTGDVLRVQSDGEVDLIGSLRFPDG